MTTDRHQKSAEDALRDSEALLAESQRMAHLGSWELDLSDLEDLNRNELRWSDESFRIFGYEPGEVRVTNELFFEHVHPDDRSAIVQAVAFALRGGGPYEIEHRITRRDGVERLCHQWARVERDRDGRPIRMIGTCQDITERKRAEWALRDSEARFRQVVENIREVFWMSDPEKEHILYVSPGYEQIWGRSCESLYRSPGSWLESIHPEDHERVFHAAHAKQRIGEYNEEYRIVRPEGTIRWIQDRAFPIRDAAGEVYRIAGIAEDITERKERERALSENVRTISKQVRQLSALNQVVQAITSTLDMDRLLSTILAVLSEHLGSFRILLMLYDARRGVAHAARMTGVPLALARAAECLEVPVKDDGSLQAELLIHGRPLTISDCQAVPKKQLPVLALLRAAGVAECTCLPLKTTHQVLGFIAVGNGKDHCSPDDLNLLQTIAGQISVAVDHARTYQELEQMTRTLERRVEERTQALQAANQKLQELNRQKSSFVSVVSHELRTPMTSIKGYIENMLDGLTGQLTERQGYYLSRVQCNIDRLTRLINDLLDLSRIEAGRVELNLTLVQLPEFLADVLEVFEPMTRAKGLTLLAEYARTPLLVEVDRDKLNQVLTNLLQNAIKFTPAGGRVLVRMEPEGGWVRFCVEDTGCGIPECELPRVFEGFYRGESVRPDQRGAGLGLAISKSLAELHGGRIWVESRVGLGSRFSFTIPIRRPERTKPRGIG
ncbi:PAS domain-containing protein [Candidatus Nitrospira bockiana]